MDLRYYENEKRRLGAFTVYVQQFCQYRAFRPHWHDYYELLYITDGSGTVHCNDTKIQAKAGDLVVVNRTEVHTMESTHGMTYYCVILHPEFFSDIVFKNIQIQNHIQNDKLVKLLMNNLYDEHSQKQAGSDMMLKSHAYALMTHLLRNYTITHLSKKETASLAEKANRLKTVLDYIDAHYSEKLSTRQLADLCHLNESYFCRSFKKATGKTIIAYINSYRIEKAAKLLLETSDNIATVATRVGFDDVAYFSKSFKLYKGVSPTHFKQ